MPFDDVFGFPVSRSTGVAAAANAAVDVARATEQRHDAATCRGGRHVTFRLPTAASNETSRAGEQPLEAFLDDENSDLRQQVATLTAEVERLRTENALLRSGAKLLSSESCDIERIAAEMQCIIKRLGGGE